MPKPKMFSCFAFFPNGEVKRWKYVTDLKSFAGFLNKSHSTWKYFNVYSKSTKEYLKRFYPGNDIPKILIALTIALTPMKNTFNKTTFINGFNNSATIPTLSSQKEVQC